MLIRPAFPDEQARAARFCQEMALSDQTQFLVAIKEQPVERIIAAFPWFTYSLKDEQGDRMITEFSLQWGATIDPVTSISEVVAVLEKVAGQAGSHCLTTKFSLLEADPLFQKLLALGFEVKQTDRYFSMPGQAAKTRATRAYQIAQKKIPKDWKLETLRGQCPEAIFHLINEHLLMPKHLFDFYWDAASPEHFDESLSCVVLNQDELIAVSLLSKRPSDELHVHVDAVAKAHQQHSGLATILMRHHYGALCPEGYPQCFTSRADSKLHAEGGNTPIRLGGKELPSRYFLSKEI